MKLHPTVSMGPVSSDAPCAVRLTATVGPLAPSVLAFDEPDVFVFGRDPSVNDRTQLPESDPTASRFHFVLELLPPHGRLRDLGSLNGTRVNGVLYGGRHPSESPERARMREQEAVVLVPGDIITAGGHSFVFDADAPRLAQPTVLAAPDVTVWPPVEARRVAQETVLGNLENIDAGPGPLPNEPGGVLAAQYDRIRLLGEGGMGVVYLVKHRESGALAALKLMQPHAALTDQMVAMFSRELKVQARLRHPNLVEVLDVGKLDGQLFAMMELCDGGSLEDLRKNRGGRLRESEALEHILQAAAGLAFIHANDAVHRDIKPENILVAGVGPTRATKITDFGLAKSLQHSVGFASKTGFAAGTPAYMPREQLVNYKRAGKPADVFALAATLYVLMSGRAPRPINVGEHPMLQVTREAIPIRRVLPGISAELEALIDRCLSGDPARRPQDGSELHAELARFRDARR